MTRPALAAVPALDPTLARPIGALLTPREVATMLRVSPSMVRSLSRQGHLAPIYIGRLPRYPVENVQAYLERQREVRR